MFTFKEAQLRESAYLGNLADVIKLIEENEVNINACGSRSRNTALHLAVLRGNRDVVKYLLRRGARLLPNATQQTALDLAIDPNVRELLVRHYKNMTVNVAEVNLTEENKKQYGFYVDETLALSLVTLKELNVFAKVLKHLHLSGMSYIHGYPLLLFIAIKDPEAMSNGKIDYLLSRCTDYTLKIHPIHTADCQGTILHSLLANGLEQDAIAFMQKAQKTGFRINPTIQDSNGLTLLHVAALMGQVKFVEQFKSLQAFEVDVRDVKGRTALHYACMVGNKAMIGLLLKLGFDLRACDSDGISAEDMLANKTGDLEVVFKDFYLDPKNSAVKLDFVSLSNPVNERVASPRPM